MERLGVPLTSDIVQIVGIGRHPRYMVVNKKLLLL